MKYAFVLLLVWAGCQKSATNASPTELASHAGAFISHGSSFGMCTGFCWREAVFTSATARFTTTARVPQPQQKNCPGQLNAAEWASLLQAVDFAAFQQLPCLLYTSPSPRD